MYFCKQFYIIVLSTVLEMQKSIFLNENVVKFLLFNMIFFSFQNVLHNMLLKIDS